jgi:hypothetical protein
MINQNNTTEETLQPHPFYNNPNEMDAPRSYKKREPVIEHEEANVGPTSTTAIVGETAPGALGGLAFDEITGEDLIAGEEPAIVRNGDWLEENQGRKSYKK